MRRRTRSIVLSVGVGCCAMLIWAGVEVVDRRLNAEFDHMGRGSLWLDEYIHSETGIVFVRVPAARFVHDEETGLEWEHVTRDGSVVTDPIPLGVDSFLVSKTPLTIAQWRRGAGDSALSMAFFCEGRIVDPLLRSKGDD